MQFADPTETVAATNHIIDALFESGFQELTAIPRRSTHKFEKEENGIREVVLMNVKSKTIDLFRGAFIMELPDTQNAVRWDRWRIRSDRKQQEVLYTILADTASVTDRILPEGSRGR